MTRTTLASVALLVATTSLAVGGAGTPPEPGTSVAPVPRTLTVLVTNDDGYDSPGIDALVEALRSVKHTKVVVVAPSTNRSGTGGRTTPGAPGALVTHAVTTPSGRRATAVDGYPADTITAAIDRLGVRPDVVMSGINTKPNLGRSVAISGTIGAARAAARRGIPAVAFSQGAGDDQQFASTGQVALEWLAQHRKALLSTPTARITEIDNVNAPNCPMGTARGTKRVITAPVAGDLSVDCTAEGPSATTDVEAFTQGYVAIASVPV